MNMIHRPKPIDLSLFSNPNQYAIQAVSEALGQALHYTANLRNSFVDTTLKELTQLAPQHKPKTALPAEHFLNLHGFSDDSRGSKTDATTPELKKDDAGCEATEDTYSEDDAYEAIDIVDSLLPTLLHSTDSESKLRDAILYLARFDPWNLINSFQLYKTYLYKSDTFIKLVCEGISAIEKTKPGIACVDDLKEMKSWALDKASRRVGIKRERLLKLVDTIDNTCLFLTDIPNPQTTTQEINQHIFVPPTIEQVPEVDQDLWLHTHAGFKITFNQPVTLRDLEMVRDTCKEAIRLFDEGSLDESDCTISAANFHDNTGIICINSQKTDLLDLLEAVLTETIWM